MRTAYDVILRPIITEQSMEDLDIKKYVFEVATDAGKIEIKTKAFKAFLDKIGVDGKALIVTESVDEKVIKSSRNIAGVTSTIATILSPYAILNNTKLVVDREALAKIEEVYA